MTYYERNLPHWHPERAEIFLTWRLCGSLPANLVSLLKLEETNPGKKFARAEQFLEKNPVGPLWLGDQQIAKCVEAALFRGESQLRQYELISWVIMPNHVHVLIRPRVALALITNGLKGVTAREANRILKRTGRSFWQNESFDHWVRDAGERVKIISYIENNPVKAGLVARPQDWPWSSKRRTIIRQESPKKPMT